MGTMEHHLFGIIVLTLLPSALSVKLSQNTIIAAKSNSDLTNIKDIKNMRGPMIINNTLWQHKFSNLKNDPDKHGFTNEEKAMLISKHNELRALVSPNATNMAFMTWEDDLEDMAQEWADRCIWEHGSPDWKHKPYDWIGQNIVCTNAGYSIDHIIFGWYGEVQYYHYDADDCDMEQQCGHYTEFVWATSRKLGCGITYCPELVNVFPHGTFVVCNYGPGGNIFGQLPYKAGDSCSDCPEDMRTCEDNLCRTSPPCKDMSCNGKGTLDTRTCICKCDEGSGAFCDRPGSDRSAYTHIEKYNSSQLVEEGGPTVFAMFMVL